MLFTYYSKIKQGVGFSFQTVCLLPAPMHSNIRGQCHVYFVTRVSVEWDKLWNILSFCDKEVVILHAYIHLFLQCWSDKRRGWPSTLLFVLLYFTYYWKIKGHTSQFSHFVNDSLHNIFDRWNLQDYLLARLFLLLFYKQQLFRQHHL